MHTENPTVEGHDGQHHKLQQAHLQHVHPRHLQRLPQRVGAAAGEGAGPRREHQGERGQHEAEDVHAGAVVVERSNPHATGGGGGGAPIRLGGSGLQALGGG